MIDTINKKVIELLSDLYFAYMLAFINLLIIVYWKKQAKFYLNLFNSEHFKANKLQKELHEYRMLLAEVQPKYLSEADFNADYYSDNQGRRRQAETALKIYSSIALLPYRT